MQSALAPDDGSDDGEEQGCTTGQNDSHDSDEEGLSDDNAQSTDDEDDVQWEGADIGPAPPLEATQAEIAGIGAAFEEDGELAEEHEDAVEAEHLAGPLKGPQGPKEVIEKALAANRRLQARLTEILAAVDRAIWRNAETQAKLMHHAEAWPRAGRYKGMRETSNAVWGNAETRVAGPSRFWVADRRVPEPNQDALKTAPAFQYLPHTFRDSSWAPQEHERLQRAILQAVDRAQSARALAGVGQLDHSISNGDAEEQPLKLDSPGVEAEVDAFGPEQWEEVARLGSAGRSGHEAATEWVHRLRPSLNLGAWTEQEDARLVQLQAQHGMHSWEIVAQELGTGRTAAACLARYQRCHNAALLDSKWTPDDAARLAAIVTRLGTANWPAVAAEMGNRTAQQVQHYYRDNVQALKKGPWAADEDAALLKAVEACGRRWREVAKLVPRRSDKQCRERFCNVLDPELKREDEWPPEEDAALRAAITQHTQPDGKVRWAKVGAQLPGRTDNSCWRRSKTLAAMERGTFKQPTAPRGSGGRFLRATAAANGDAPTPRQTDSGAGGSETAHVGDEETAAEPGSEIDRSAGPSGVGEEDKGDVGQEAEEPQGRKRRGRGLGGGGKRAARSSAASAGGKEGLDTDEREMLAVNRKQEKSRQVPGAGPADMEAGPPRKKPRKQGKR